MSNIGVRELKAQLSRQLKRVQGRTRLTITDRGRPIAPEQGRPQPRLI